MRVLGTLAYGLEMLHKWMDQSVLGTECLQMVKAMV